ncbi:MAG TPA: PIN domain-containing protein [Pirellulales bacterium]|nr:PIN domain-containing protein [Pirellulales bacterium]
MNAIDTNIFAYAFDPADPGKQAKARQLLFDLVAKPPESVLLWQVAVEFLAFLRKAEGRGRLTAEEVKTRFQEVLQLFSVQLPTVRIFERGFNLYERYSLSHWDSLLIAACHEAGVTRLYSEDMQHGADYDGVTIVNPFT